MSPPDIRMPTTKTALRPTVARCFTDASRHVAPLHVDISASPSPFSGCKYFSHHQLTTQSTQRAGGPANTSSLSREG
ncbi:hypothetical protein FA95DRAFT_1565842 [Auriscalpium vulgare]|uniref:Uncharacterized protein n=1 Tax=Auriscalpium vulgare TaxID=40419 RepID=A0ACB8RA65_9AGAM|nr:hypothetical protein FA95DRAFT_1565842 [Auriscalpium vulgare]